MRLSQEQIAVQIPMNMFKCIGQLNYEVFVEYVQLLISENMEHGLLIAMFGTPGE